jgi:transcriptional regulator with XRE-family HTH domain
MHTANAKTPPIVGASMARSRKERTAFAKRLVAARTRRQLTQVELADALGVTQPLISLYERGLSEPSAAVIAAIARELRVSADELLGVKPPSRAENATDRENLRLMRKLRQVQQLPPRDRRAVVQFINALVAQREMKAARD